jgi:D-xylose transport system ATP-binding protein
MAKDRAEVVRWQEDARGSSELRNTMLLQIQHLSKNFGGVTALNDVALKVASGEVVGLVGDNGAGKSTLIKVISGVLRPDGGSMRVGGRDVMIHSPKDAALLGIQTVYQDLALCDNLDVVANMFLGNEQVSGIGPFHLRRLSEVQMEHRARESLRSLKITTLPSLRVPVGSLSGGQRQAIAIARAVSRAARLLLLDEPTAALGVAQAETVRRLIGALKSRGIAVVLISHNLEDVFATADRIEVLRLGRNAGSYPAARTTPHEVVAAITGGQDMSWLR